MTEQAAGVVHEVIAGFAARTPNATALITDDARVGYAELDARAARVAAGLRVDGVRPGDVVGVRLPRGVDLVVAVLGVLRAGAAYTMLDPRFPDARHAEVCALAGVRRVLTACDLADAGDTAREVLDDPVSVSPDDLACVMFTSGSTGTPKGVATTHRALVTTLLGQSYVESSADAVWLQCSPVSWDAFALELFGALLSGASCVLQPGQTPEPAVIADLLTRHAVSTLHVSSGLLNLLVDEYPDSLGGIRELMTGGEAPSATHLARLLERHPGIALVNGYSPVENTIFTLCHRVTSADTAHAIPVGTALRGKDVHLLGPDLRPVPDGALGEVYMAGDGLAQCYVARAALTAERFVANPFAPGTRMYRTGDLGVRRGGLLTLHGRADDQIKIRGFRIEPAEVVAALTAHPAVRRAAVSVWEPRPGDRRLVGYVVTTAPVGADELRAHTATRLPEHLVPSVVVELDALPLTATGKLDRAALPTPTLHVGRGGGARTDREAVLCDLVAGLLGLPEVGVDDDLLALGGHSLTVATLVSRVRAAFGVTLRMADVFAAATPAAIAALTETVGSIDTADADRPALVAGRRPDPIPLSRAQSRIWLADRIDGGATYTIPITLRLRGALDRDALRGALGDVVTRHEALRTVFPVVDGTPVQRIGTAAPRWVEHDATADPDALAAVPFDLTVEPPLRAHLLRAGAEDHTLLLVLHHIAADGWSTAPLLRDLGAAYRARVTGGDPDWPTLPVQYADYTLWEHAGPERVEQERYWRDALAGAPGECTPAADRPRPATRSAAGGAVTLELDAATHTALRAVAARTGTTVFMVVHTALVALLHRLGAGSDVVIGTPVAGRSDEALDDLVGLFVNTLALRTDASGDPTFGELLARVRETDLGAYDHRDVGFDRVVELVNPSRSLARHPLFQVMLVLQNTAQAMLDLGAATCGAALDVEYRVRHLDVAKFDLTLDLAERADGGLGGPVSYATDLFDPATATAFVARFTRMLGALATDLDTRIGAADLLDDTERATLASWGSGSRPPAVTRTLPELVAAAPRDALAVVAGEHRVTYGELVDRANQLAHELRGRGVRPGDVVGVLTDRDASMVVAVLAVLTVGGAYTVLDPRFPARRHAAVAAAARMRHLIADAGTTLDGVQVVTPRAEHQPVTAPPVRVWPADAACVMFTSGSTGTPKGVVTSHEALIATLVDQSYVDVSPGDVWLQCSPVSWDAFALELFAPLLSGATCVLQPGHVTDPALIADLVDRHDVDTLHVSASLLNHLVDEHPRMFASLRQVMTGGEAASLDHVARLLSQRPDLHLVNGYSPVENTIFTLCHPITAHDTTRSAIPVGRPIAATVVHVLDANLRPVPVGVPGEIYMAGTLAHGYLGLPGASAERFVADPQRPGQRMYRTGDLGRWNAHGVIDYLGRADDQIKIRGFRIEPAEITTALSTHTAVRAAAVVVREDTPGDRRLVAYLVGDLHVADIRDHVARTLPEHLRPSAYMVLDALPLTPNGKLDRAALPTPTVTATGARAPRTPREDVLRSLVADVLGLAPAAVDLDAGFFALGGHSLLAARLAGRIRTTLGLDAGVRDVFAAPTLADLARTLDAGSTARPPRPVRAIGARPDRLPLGPAQAGLWFLNRVDPASATYNIPVALRLRGDLDVAALRAAVADVVARHEVLRTTYPLVDDTPCQLIAAGTPTVHEVVATGAAAVEAAVTDAATAPFDLVDDQPLRVTLVRAGADEWVLVLVLHHIAGDGGSLAPLVRDLAQAYGARRDGRAPGWSPLPVQFADHTLWQHQLLDEVGPAQVEYWRATLADLPAELSLPTDRARPATPTHRGATVPVRVSADAHRELVAFAAAERVTVFMVLHAAFAALLTRHGAGVDVPIGTPVAGRDDDTLDDVVGYLVNTLVLRTDTGGDPTFRALLDRVRGTDLAAYDHRDVPFDRLVEQLNPQRSTTHHPLFQVMLALRPDVADTAPELPGLTVSTEPAPTGVAKFDLSLILDERADGGIDGFLEYATDLFDAATATTLAKRFTRLLTAAVADPDTALHALPVLTDAERATVLTEHSGSDVAPCPDPVHVLVSRVAERTPDAIAVVDETTSLTYRDLDVRANRLAHTLLDAGVRPGDVVGVGLPRDATLVVAVLAVLKVGAAYTMLDPDFPAPRLAAIAEQAGVTVVVGAVVAGTRTITDTAAGAADTAPAVAVDPADTACVMFTSGSTGRPKGIAAPHRALTATLLGQDHCASDADEVWLQCSPVSWDAFALELFAPLLAGAVCVLHPPGRPDPTVIADLVARHGVRTLHVSARLLDHLVDEHPSVFDGLRRVLTGGEAASVPHLARLRATHPGLVIINGYSPAENMIFTLTRAVSDVDIATGVVPVGVPLHGKRVFVLDAALDVTAPGVPGELYMAGPGLAHGYTGQPATTAERFVACPLLPGQRMYRTGDLVRMRPDGVVEFLGRADDQVKVRGFRVEPAEIADALTAHPAVRQAAVVVRDGRLVAYLVGELPPPAARDHLAARLPDHLVPSVFVELDALPRTANGKLDRAALPAPQWSSAGGSPRTAREEILCGLVARVLGVPEVGVHDGFFALGGHSLLAATLVARVRSTLGADLRIRDVFSNPTPAGLAARLDTTGPQRPVLAPREHTELVALSAAQSRLWFAEQQRAGTYNVPFAATLTGPVDATALRAAVADLVERHDVLRTVYPTVDGVPHQHVLPGPVPTVYADVDAQDDIETVIDVEAARPFDLAVEVPLRVRLLRAAVPDEHVLLVVVHHIAADGWSMRPLLGDLAHAYAARLAGRAPQWSPLPVRYIDYALWHRDLLATTGAQQLAYWRSALSDLSALVSPPADRSRPATPSYRGDTVAVRWSPELAAGVHELAERHGATPFMVVHAALAALLTRHGAGTDTVVGTPTAGRVDPALDDLVGFFVNTLVLRADTAGDPTFADLLARVRDADLAALDHQDAPFEQVVEHLNPVRSPDRHPLFQVMLVLQNAEGAEVELAGTRSAPRPVANTTARFDLTVSLTDTGDGVTGYLEYATDLYDRTTVERFGEHLARLLAAVVADPGVSIADVDLLDDADRAAISAAGTGAPAVPVVPVHDLIAAHAKLTPDAVAVVAGSRRVTYHDLVARSEKLAARLRARGVRPGEIVGVLRDRDDSMVVAILAVLAAGGTYTMLDPRLPDARIADLLTRSGTRFVVTDDGERLPAGVHAVPGTADPVDPVPVNPVTVDSVTVDPADAACVMFTSGSTGAPKGVVTSHEALVATLVGQSYVDVAPGDVWLQCSPVSWDAFALELFAPLLHGATCVLLPDHHTDPALIADLVHKENVDTLHVSASLLNHLLDEHPSVFDGLRQVMTGGEPASPDHLARLLDQRPDLHLVNGYSPVENTIFTLCHRVTAHDTTRPTIPVGTPIAAGVVHVLDGRLRPVPDGVAGEAYMGGTLAHGYLGQPGLTAERFVADPYRPGQRMYRTGDVVRRRADGVIDYLGRADDQIKIRGFRIEPAEITTALCTHTAVRRGAVVVREDTPGDRRLIAYLVGAGDLHIADVRDHVARLLPEHLRPSAYMVLDDLPITPNGKLDRAALPAPVFAGEQGTRARTAREEILCGLVAQVLGLPAAVDLDAGFFDLGGHSLLAARLVGRIRGALGTDVGVADVFAAPTMRALAARIDSRAGTAPRPVPVRVEHAGELPLSPAQHRLWFLDRLHGPDTAYVVAHALHLRGDLDTPALRAAMADLVARHDALRTVFPAVDGVPRQVVRPVDRVALTLHTRDIDTAVVDTAVVDTAVRDAARYAFDLAAELPIRATLLRVSATEHILVLAIHHIAADGWSMGPLLRDLGTAYAARAAGVEPQWAPLPLSYGDYTLWQRELLDQVGDGQLTHWRTALAGLPEVVPLPVDHPHADRSRADLAPVAIGADVHRQLTELARRTGTTLFMVVQAAFAALLTRHGAGTDVPLGVPVAGRTDPALDDLVGFFVNTLVLRADTSGDPTFAELLDRVRAVDLAAFDHQDVPFEQVVDAVNPARTGDHPPLFQHMVVLQNTAEADLQLPGLGTTLTPLSTGAAKFDLVLALREGPTGLDGALEYAADRFDRDTAHALVARFVRFLTAVATDADTSIGSVDLLDDDEYRALVGDRAGLTAAADGTARCLHEVVAEHAVATPDALALVAGTDRVSYRDLVERAHRLAHHLVASGVRPGDAVGVRLERDADLVVAVLGVLAAGAGYTMLDPRLPAARVASILTAAGSPPVITDAAGAAWLGSSATGQSVRTIDVAGVPASAPTTAPTVDTTPDDVACVMFTSGSTGVPKGVVTPHRALSTTLLGQSYVDVAPGDVWLQCSPVSWDAFALELFAPLLHGATCVLQPGHHTDPALIADLVHRENVDTLHVSASLLNHLLDEHPRTFDPLRQVMTGGEPASPDHLARLLDLKPGLHLVNGYSPVENTIFTLCHRVTAHDTTRPTIPVGTTLPGTRTYLLDAHLRPVPPGVPAEVYMAGTLAHGYLGLPGLTAERFVADPQRPGQRMYRTGDLGRWNTSGVIDYLGRADDQIKIRGFRIEPAEITTALSTHPAVRRAAVVVRTDAPGGVALVGYVVGDPGLTVAAVREHAERVLPEHLRPAAYVVLDDLPINANGKLDRAALPAPVFAAERTSRAPRTPREEVLCGLFAELLGLPDGVGVDDDFFALGGHSLLVSRLVSRVRAAFDVELSLKSVFEARTVAALVGRLGTAERARPALRRRTRPEEAL